MIPDCKQEINQIQNQKEFARFLLKHLESNHDINSVVDNSCDQTLLSIVVEMKKWDFAEILLDLSADAFRKNVAVNDHNLSSSILQALVENKQPHLVKKALEIRIPPNNNIMVTLTVEFLRAANLQHIELVENFMAVNCRPYSCVGDNKYKPITSFVPSDTGRHIIELLDAYIGNWDTQFKKLYGKFESQKQWGGLYFSNKFLGYREPSNLEYTSSSDNKEILAEHMYSSTFCDITKITPKLEEYIRKGYSECAIMLIKAGADLTGMEELAIQYKRSNILKEIKDIQAGRIKYLQKFIARPEIDSYLEGFVVVPQGDELAEEDFFCIKPSNANKDTALSESPLGYSHNPPKACNIRATNTHIATTGHKISQ